MKMRKKKSRRCDIKSLTKEATLLKYLRESRQISMRMAGRLVGTSSATINHTENGRRDLTPSIIIKFVEAYGYTYEQFEQMLNGNLEIPEHLRSECLDILQRLDESKLKTVKAFLMTF
jgi:transcriptional regulator with XRE-family HTH domain